MTTHTIRIEGINPSPWTAPTVSTSRRGKRVVPQVHKNAELRSYQAAIKQVLGWDEESKERTDDGIWTLPTIETPVALVIYFWRRIEKYERSDGVKVRKHRADATNLQKALEDAIQGIVIKNDSQVQVVQSCIVEEGDEVEPYIIINVCGEEEVTMSRAGGAKIRNEW